MTNLSQHLKVGLIQPVLDSDSSWGGPTKVNKKLFYELNVDSITAARVWGEIKAGIAAMLKEPVRPDIILIPELHLPVSKLADIRHICRVNGILFIAGIDFQRHPARQDHIRNRAVISIPNNFGNDLKATRQNSFYFGKTYFTYMERQMFKHGILNGGVAQACKEDPEQTMFIFQSQRFGNFGLIICSDIFDIERMMLYQGQIHHLFIIALNKDLNTYFAMAESLTRLLYCNVVICNSGFYGGSLAMSPYEKDYQRLIYKYQGQQMFNIQVVSLPVAELDRAQDFDYGEKDKKEANIPFKASPPGYRKDKKKDRKKKVITI
ncbi:hypothetical protein [Desertivirga brevis]|uniref:hypothetical protein n=1 Tax=Desertivirga brevis TaxID=2810310 RepID=UPI001A95D285|nr:hypothetical protein [Pedobacter sp. SYSU D00873]